MKLTWKRVAVLLFLAVVCIFTLVGRIKFDSVVDDMMEKQIKKVSPFRIISIDDV